MKNKAKDENLGYLMVIAIVFTVFISNADLIPNFIRVISGF